jgi:adenosine deaminase
MTRDLPALLRKLPKVELHLHLEGSIAAATAVDLSRRHGIPLPDRPDLYAFADLVDFLSVYSAVAAAVRHVDDFRRVTYEMLASCAANGARYVEFFFSPHVHLQEGIAYPVQLDGIRAGMREAEADFGVISRIIPGISRELGPAAGFEMLDLILADRPDELIGIGLDFNEAPFPPEPYGPLFAHARRAGLHVTSHAGETGPAAYVRGSLDALGSERIDHGYAVVNDVDLMRRCKDDGVVFTVCPSTSEITSPWHDLSAPDHAIRRMIDFGLKVCINSDDPPMFRTDLGLEYEKASVKLKLSPEDIITTILTGLDGSWLDDSVKRRLYGEWTAEMNSIILGSKGPAA